MFYAIVLILSQLIYHRLCLCHILASFTLAHSQFVQAVLLRLWSGTHITDFRKYFTLSLQVLINWITCSTGLCIHTFQSFCYLSKCDISRHLRLQRLWALRGCTHKVPLKRERQTMLIRRQSKADNAC